MPTTSSVLGPGIGESQRRLLDLVKRSGGCTLAELEAVVGILSDEGFVADLEGSGAGRRLRLGHCPLRGLVAVPDLPCRFEQALIDGLLGARSSREAFIPEGGHACTYSIPAARRKLEGPFRRTAASKKPA